MEHSRRRRMLLVALMIPALALLAGFRLYQLQVVRGDALRARAVDQHEELIDVPSTRGAIVDRNGRELAVSLAAESFFAHARRVEYPERAAELLAPLISLSRSEIVSLLTSGKKFVYLERALDPQQAAAIRELDLPIGKSHPFGFHDFSKRFYPRGQLGVHVVGFASIDGKGLEGAEKTFDETLSGDGSVYLLRQDAAGGEVSHLVRGPTREARDVVLTLDAVLQHTVERELKRALRESGARSGSALVMDPGTGQVLAMANLPTLNANRFPKSNLDERRNRAVVDQFEPGSTFKIVTMAAALENGVVRPSQRFDCENGAFKFLKNVFHDSSPHKILSVREIMQHSSNIGMIKIGQALDPAALSSTITEFGFGATTGIELPGEARGLVRPVDRWSEYSRASLMFGHEVSVTTLQMASAISVVANHGMLVPPRILLGERGADGNLEPAPGPGGRRVISAGTARHLSAMLEDTVTDGTGVNAKVAGYRVAGKTGTAQKIVDGTYSKTDYVASFGGFAPVHDPRLTVLVVLDSPKLGRHHGNTASAPAFSRIMADALAYLRIPSENEVIAVGVEPRSDLPTQTASRRR